MASLLTFLCYAQWLLYGFLLGVLFTRLRRRLRRARQDGTPLRWQRWEKHCERHAEATKGSTAITPPGLMKAGPELHKAAKADGWAFRAWGSQPNVQAKPEDVEAMHRDWNSADVFDAEDRKLQADMRKIEQRYS